MTETERRPLDAALYAYVEGLHAAGALKDDLLGKAKANTFFREPVVSVHINDRAISFRCKKSDDQRVDTELMRTPELEELAAALRARMPDIAWPITIRIKMEGLSTHGEHRSAYLSPKCCGIGYANIVQKADLGLRDHDEIFHRTDSWYSSGMQGLDNLADALDPIAEILPSSNRPVMAWQEMSDMMGSDHAFGGTIYAKTEIEAILKQMLRHEGVAALHEMIAQRKFVRQNNIEHTWFVATDIGYLDEDPLGRVARADNLLDTFEETLDFMDSLSSNPKP